MASRKEQKEVARQRRLAEEQAAASRQQRTRRLQLLGGMLSVVVVVVVVLIIVSSGGGGSGKAVAAGSKQATATSKLVTRLLKGIPQHGTALGNPHARVTVTEYGDLQCPICADFAKGAENQLISNDVRSGKVRLVYKSFETATANGPDASMWYPQQAAAYAAGVQGKAWNYIEVLYREQGQEGTHYVDTSFLNGIAKQVPGLNFKKWSHDRSKAAYRARIMKESSMGASMPYQPGQQPGTPALIASGPVSQTKAVAGDLSYSGLESLIKSVA